jgi:hypothetical protein
MISRPRDLLASLEYYDPVAHGEDIDETVRDDDLGNALFFQFQHRLEKPFGRITERLAVGSSRITKRGSKEIARAIATDC